MTKFIFITVALLTPLVGLGMEVPLRSGRLLMNICRHAIGEAEGISNEGAVNARERLVEELRAYRGGNLSVTVHEAFSPTGERFRRLFVATLPQSVRRTMAAPDANPDPLRDVGFTVYDSRDVVGEGTVRLVRVEGSDVGASQLRFHISRLLLSHRAQQAQFGIALMEMLQRSAPRGALVSFWAQNEFSRGALDRLVAGIPVPSVADEEVAEGPVLFASDRSLGRGVSVDLPVTTALNRALGQPAIRATVPLLRQLEDRGFGVPLVLACDGGEEFRYYVEYAF